MKTPNISPLVHKNAPLILAEIDKVKHILLHCHPSPDPDSVGSVLAMKFVLEGMGKKVTAIKGDSDIPEAFMHFPGAKDIIAKNFFEVDLNEFDLFIILDCGALEMISRRGEVKFPNSLNTIIIDHHLSNTKFANINMVDFSYPANCELLFDVFQEWKVQMTVEIASNLFMGIYTDTGFKYPGVTTRTFETAARLVTYIPNVSELISRMENSNTPESIAFGAMALSSVETFLDGRLAISSVSNKDLKDKNIPALESSSSSISSIMRTVKGWEIDAALVEIEPDSIKVSLRSQDINKYDVSKLAISLGGGGHKGAAGAILKMTLDEAKKLVVTKAKELYRL